MRISDWSSDVCSSDLGVGHQFPRDLFGDAATRHHANAHHRRFARVQRADFYLSHVDHRRIDTEPGQLVALLVFTKRAFHRTEVSENQPGGFEARLSPIDRPQIQGQLSLPLEPKIMSEEPCLSVQALDFRSEEHTSELQSLM